MNERLAEKIKEFAEYAVRDNCSILGATVRADYDETWMRASTFVMGLYGFRECEAEGPHVPLALMFAADVARG